MRGACSPKIEQALKIKTGYSTKQEAHRLLLNYTEENHGFLSEAAQQEEGWWK